ncbi:unnamed protein product [Prorocentrum cordatum]|uniref:Subtilisin n=1 Tax=Prorocentrum cordatum TaxID=2364126 RepID=A0ABN9X181_9DINO|nr:unnamed protein product [Polarella glacialis]
MTAGSVAAQQDVGGEVGPDVLSYGAGIRAYDKGNQWQRSLALLGQIARGDVGAQRHLCYHNGISRVEKGKQSQQALSLLRTTWEAKVKPDIISCSAGISAGGKSDQRQRSGRRGRRNWSPP